MQWSAFVWSNDRRAARCPRRPAGCHCPMVVASAIFARASSMVKLLGFCTVGKSLKVSANLLATIIAPKTKGSDELLGGYLDIRA